MSAGKVFYAVLNMGLGHAARSLPLIREFLRRGWEMLLGSNGRALEFLKLELPDTAFRVTPDYQIEYTRRRRTLLPKLAFQMPGLLQTIREEQRCCEKIVNEFSPDLIISDHCYGMYHQRVPSYFISHQIYFAMPPGLNLLAPLGARFNIRFHQNYRKVIIPDLPGGSGGLLSGELSRLPPGSAERYAYGGILSSITREECSESLDVLVSISGPEPQRTLLEQKILEQIETVPGKKVLVLGKSEASGALRETPDLRVYPHLPRREMNRFFNCAELIVSRPGYSTLMELAELGKKALLIPTPGQTEQASLARRIMKKRWFYAVDQDALELGRDLALAREYAGLFKPGVTAWSVGNIFDNILNLK